MTYRKVVAAVESDAGDLLITTVFCDDGSVWYTPADDPGAWKEGRPVPGTQRDEEWRQEGRTR